MRDELTTDFGSSELISGLMTGLGSVVDLRDLWDLSGLNDGYERGLLLTDFARMNATLIACCFNSAEEGMTR